MHTLPCQKCVQVLSYTHIKIDLVSNKKQSSITFFDNFFSFIFHFTLPYFFPSRVELIIFYVLVTKFLVPDLNCLIHSFIYQFEISFISQIGALCAPSCDHPQSYIEPIEMQLVLYNTNIYPCAERIYTKIVIRYFAWFGMSLRTLRLVSKVLQISNIQNMLCSYNALARIAYIIWEQPKL